MDSAPERKNLLGLLAELSSVPKVFPEIPCALSARNPCCRGRGYLVRANGPYAKAELCSCVLKCQNCLGLAQKVVNRVVRPCRIPPPRKVVNLYNQAMIPSRYASAHLGIFKNMTGNCPFVVQEIKQWLRYFRTTSERKGLILSGPVGVGKTYLITALAKSLAEQGVSTRFVDFFQLLSHIRAAYSENKSDQDILRPLIAVDVLIIDELGKGRNTDFEAVVLDQIVMNRYNENKILVASTNLSLKETAQDDDNSSFNYFGSFEARVGKRIYSRLLETTKFIEMQGDDFRKKV